MIVDASSRQRMKRLHLPILILSALTSGRAPGQIGTAGPGGRGAGPRDLPQAHTATGSQLSSSEADALLTEGKNFYAANDFVRAEAAARRFLAAQPDSAQAAYLLARVLEHRGSPKESLEWFSRAAKVAVPSSEDLRLVAMDYVLLDDYPDAIHWLQRSAQSDPGNAEIWYDLGRAFMTQGDYTTAEKMLTRALELHPKLVKAENNLGLVYERQNRTSDAADAYRRSIAWQEGEPRPSEQPLLNYGILLLTQQRSAEALPLLARAAVIAPHDAKTHEQLAHALEQQGQVTNAEQHMEEAVKLEPQNAALHYQLGLMYRRSGDLEKSKQEIALSSKLYGTRSSADR